MSIEPSYWPGQWPCRVRLLADILLRAVVALRLSKLTARGPDETREIGGGSL